MAKKYIILLNMKCVHVCVCIYIYLEKQVTCIIGKSDTQNIIQNIMFGLKICLKAKEEAS